MADLDKFEWAVDCLKARVDSWDRERRDADPCWEGYEQRGTKEKDGRTVPNCVEADAQEATGYFVIINGNSDKYKTLALAKRALVKFAEDVSRDGTYGAKQFLLAAKAWTGEKYNADVALAGRRIRVQAYPYFD